MKLPEPEHTTINAIDAYFEQINEQEKPRQYMGVSILGHACDRWLWLSFRWAVRERLPGRVLRLFRRGQVEEELVVSDLEAIGVVIEHTGDDQKLVDFGGWVKGHPDGIILSGIPEAPKSKHVWENKTHNRKSFDDLEKNGLEKSKPMHHAQLQVYMLGEKIERGLYYATCKDDDRIYIERVRLDKEFASAKVKRGQRIALLDRMPEPLSADPTWYACQWCPAYRLCHQGFACTEVNCRTCAHSTFRADETVYCERWNDAVPLDVQYTGCSAHVFHPDLVPWKLDRDKSTTWSAAYEIDGMIILNGEDGFPSTEIAKNQMGEERMKV